MSRSPSPASPWPEWRLLDAAQRGRTRRRRAGSGRRGHLDRIGRDRQGALLGELYAQALIREGASVTHQRGLDRQRTILQQVERGELTLVPELTNRC